MSTYTAAGDRMAAEERAVVLLRNETAESRSVTVVIDGEGTTTRQVTLSSGEVGVVAAPVAGHVTAAVHVDDASASLSFDPGATSAPPLFALREGRVLVSPE